MSAGSVVFVNSIKCPSCGLLTSGYLHVHGNAKGTTTCPRCGASIIQEVPPGSVQQLPPPGFVESGQTHARRSLYAWLYAKPKEQPPRFCLGEMLRVRVVAHGDHPVGRAEGGGHLGCGRAEALPVDPDGDAGQGLPGDCGDQQVLGTPGSGPLGRIGPGRVRGPCGSTGRPPRALRARRRSGSPPRRTARPRRRGSGSSRPPAGETDPEGRTLSLGAVHRDVAAVVAGDVAGNG